MFRGITRIQHPQKTPMSANPLKEMHFKTGDTFKGTVVQKYPGKGEILVSVRGERFRAHTGLGLKEGEEYRFQVKYAGPRIELRVLAGKPHRGDSLVNDWAVGRDARQGLSVLLRDLAAAHTMKDLTPPAREALIILSRLLPSFVYGKPEDQGVSWVMNYLQKSGLFWENKVVRYLLRIHQKGARSGVPAGDLKGILLSLEAALGKGGSGDRETEGLALKVREALQLIEQDQFLNLTSLREEAGWCFFVPGLQEEGFLGAEVFVSKESKGGEIRFIMLLEFSELGQMEVMLTIQEAVLNARILLEDEGRAALVREHLSLLEESLRDGGIKAGTIACGVREAEDPDSTGPFPDGPGAVPGVDLLI